MRVRATRLSATGANSPALGPLNMAALFAAQPGREGTFYGWSWDEILATNEKALGPQLVSNGDLSQGVTGFTSPSFATLSASGGTLTATNTIAAFTRIATPVFDITAGRTYIARLPVRSSGSGVGNVQLYIGGSLSSNTWPAVAAGGFVMALLTATATGAAFLRLEGQSSAIGGTLSVGAIAVQELDLSKIVAFEDSVGTVPLLAPLGVGKGCGLLLDREYGLVRGPELVTNGSCTGITGWTGNVNLTNPGGASIRADTGSGGSEASAVNLCSVVAGRTYEVRFNLISANNSGAVAIGGNRVIIPGPTSTNSGPKSLILRAVTSSVNGLTFSTNTPTAGYHIEVDDVSVREIRGNHAEQPTAAARGEMSRRVNLLVTTNMASSGATSALGWVGESSVVSGLYTPNIVGNAPSNLAAGGNRRITEVGGIAAGTPVSFRIKVTGAASAATVRLFAVQASSDTVITFQEAVVQPGASAVLTVTASSPTAGIRYCFASSHPVFVDEPDLRLQADAIPSLPAHQRVTSAADYDEVGFPAYLRRQTDDWMRTRINPNGATKVEVFTAIQKINDSAPGMLLESSVATDTNNGTFFLMAPRDGGQPNAGFRSKGTTQSDSRGVGIPAPARALIRGRGDIAADVSAIHINGALAGSSSADQGTGPYTEQTVFIGAREGVTLFANLREYSPPLLIFMQPADPGLSASQIARIEREINKSIRAY